MRNSSTIARGTTVPIRVSAAVATLAASVLLLGACTADDPPPIPTVTVTTLAPAEDLTVIAEKDAAAAAIKTSKTLFDTSPVVVVAPADDADAQLIAASGAVALGVPVLLSPPKTGGSKPASAAVTALTDELDRLNVTSVVAVGKVSAIKQLGKHKRDVTQVAAVAAALKRALRLTPPPTPVSTGVTAVSAIAALAPGDETILMPNGAPATPTPSPAPTADRPVVPTVQRGKALSDDLALALDAPAQLASVASARAAGMTVQLVPPDQPNPLASADTMTSLSDAQPHSVLALGAGFGSDPALGWEIGVATSGAQLPGGGGLWFPGHTLVAIYGTPGAPVLGVLGEQDLAASITRAQNTAAPYKALTSTPVVPMFEIIATVAAGGAGDDGNYSNEVPIATIRPWIDAAAQAGIYVVLDLQPGRSDFLTQAKEYAPLLKLPNVGLALDPEWRLAPGEFPLNQIGTVSAAEVNAVITWLADLTRDHDLPQKILVLHQFQNRMIQDRAAVDTSRAELAIVIHADGQGTQPAKQATWAALHVDAPAGIWWGWKNFYDEDHPTLTPVQTMTEVVPPPNLISYQ